MASLALSGYNKSIDSVKMINGQGPLRVVYGLFATSYMVKFQMDKRMNNGTMLPTLNKAAAGYQGPVKTKILKGAGIVVGPAIWAILGGGGWGGGRVG